MGSSTAYILVSSSSLHVMHTGNGLQNASVFSQLDGIVNGYGYGTTKGKEQLGLIMK